MRKKNKEKVEEEEKKNSTKKRRENKDRGKNKVSVGPGIQSILNGPVYEYHYTSQISYDYYLFSFVRKKTFRIKLSINI